MTAAASDNQGAAPPADMADPAQLERLVTLRMPFGKYQGRTLAELPGANKVAILGDMSDLGDTEEAAHRQLGAYAATRIQRLVTKGLRVGHG